MLVAALLGLLFVVILAPHFWIKYVFKRYNTAIDSLPGTGGELAQHLINRLNLNECKVEISEKEGDHYNPENKTVCLSPGVHDHKSITAVVIAAHEVGHALQHDANFKPLYLRCSLARFIAVTEKLASIVLISFPFVTMLSKLPIIGVIMLASGLSILVLPIVFHLVTLPVEWDASFNRALPILIEGQYLPADAEPVVRRILTAAALTYVSASLASLLNFYRWIAFLRR